MGSRWLSTASGHTRDGLRCRLMSGFLRRRTKRGGLRFIETESMTSFLGSERNRFVGHRRLADQVVAGPKARDEAQLLVERRARRRDARGDFDGVAVVR